MAKTGRVCDFTGKVYALNAPKTGTIVVTVDDKVTTYDCTLEGVKEATEGWPEGSTRTKYHRKPTEGDETAPDASETAPEPVK